MKLNPIQQKFILHWGEMGTRWGINRTVAQIHALLFLCSEPIHAEEIAKTLAVARSNVSTSLRELQSWGIVKVVHVLGDRRDHFECMKDVWEMFNVVVEERKRREMDPTLAMLRASVAELENSASSDTHTRERLREMLEFFETMSSFYAEIRRMPAGTLRQAAKLRGKVRKVLGFPAAG